jgi:prolyl-tRNA editing enzyme YbaK/EbsC (Cys-tRNA(Pro) deacylase)
MNASAANPVNQRLRRWLLDAGISFREVEHAPTLTSAESAAARGEPLGVGAKALLLRTDDVYGLFVLPADLRLDSASVKRQLALKRLRFATADELLELTGLVPGSVPPFGEPVLPFPLFADTAMGERYDRVAFNAGTLTNSFIMSAADWRRVAQPQVFSFGRSD